MKKLNHKKTPLSTEQLAECEALKKIFNEKKAVLGLTQERAAQHLGMNQGSFSHYLNGRNAINITFALSVAQLLDISVGSFSPRLAETLGSGQSRALDAFSHYRLSGPGAESQPPEDDNPLSTAGHAYPVLDWQSVRLGADWSYDAAYDPEVDGRGSDLVGSTENAGKTGFWLPVLGTSMLSASAPSFPEGVYILIQLTGFDLENGKFYLARNGAGEITFRQHLREAGVSYLVPLNPSFKTVEVGHEWTIFARAIDARMPGI